MTKITHHRSFCNFPAIVPTNAIAMRITSRFLTMEIRIQPFAAHLRDLLDLAALHVIQ